MPKRDNQPSNCHEDIFDYSAAFVNIKQGVNNETFAAPRHNTD